MLIQPGATLGSYSILEQLGRGGMAAVYKAYHQRLDRYVAIKVMLASISQDEGFQERFQQEARAVARLNHPNIITIHDYGEEQGLSYLVTELIEGGTLADRIGGPIDPALAARILGPIASALDYAHDRGILHRDVKPSNILLRLDESPVLSDFGIAKLNDSSQHMTRTGLIMGTPAYQAPEQASGEPASSATDQYALGVVAYELLTGRVPYSADTPMAVLLAHLVKPLPPPRQINPSLSPGLEAAVVKALAKDPNDRFSSVTAFALALAEAVEGGTAAAGWPFVTTSPFGGPMTPSRPVTAPGLQPRPTPTPLPPSTPGNSPPAAATPEVIAPDPASRLAAPLGTPPRPYVPPLVPDNPQTPVVMDSATVVEQTPISENLPASPSPGLGAPEAAAGPAQGQAALVITTLASPPVTKAGDDASASTASPPTKDIEADRLATRSPQSSGDQGRSGLVAETPAGAPIDRRPRLTPSETPNPISTPERATTAPPAYNPPAEHIPPAARHPAPPIAPAAAYQPGPSFATGPTSTPAPPSLPAAQPTRAEDRGDKGLVMPPVVAIAGTATVESAPINGVGTAKPLTAREAPVRDASTRVGTVDAAPSAAQSTKSVADYAPATQVSSAVPATAKQPVKKTQQGAKPTGASRVPIAVAGGIALVLLVGAIAAVNLMGRSTGSQPAAPTADPTLAPVSAFIATASAALPTAVAALPTSISAAAPTELPTEVPTAQPTEAPTARPTSEPTTAPTTVSSVAPTPTESQAWAATSDSLNSVWGSDWPKAITVLDAFHTQHPTFAPASEKLYAALISYGDQLAKGGDKANAAAQYQKAQTLLPDRTEAAAALSALTPTPAAPPTSLPAPQPTPTPTPVPPTTTTQRPPQNQPPQSQPPPVQPPTPTRAGPKAGFTPT